MGLIISRWILKISVLLLFALGGVYFLRGDRWPEKNSKAVGIIMVILVAVMIVSLLVSFSMVEPAMQ